MYISNNGIRLIANFEGWSSCPYYDSYGHVWTRGFGETGGIGPGSRCLSLSEGYSRLRDIFNSEYAWAINDLHVPLTQNQFDALGSFVWNLGPGTMQWNVGRSLRNREYYQAANEMLGYDMAGGVYLSGLARRRAEERALFLTSDGPVYKPKPVPFIPADELRWRHEYDHLLRINKNKPRRIVLRRYMTDRRKKIYEVATHQKNGWNILNRYNRYQSLKARTK